MTLSIDEIVGIAFRSKGSLIHRGALAHLCRMAQGAPAGTGVEIGVYRGSSLVAWSLARSGMGESIGVDNWSYPDPPNLKEHTEENLKQAGVTATLYDMDSEDAAALIPGPLAFVHIDANHTLAYVRKDIELWAPKLMRGGVIAFHDYGRTRADIQVRQAVDEWQAREPWACLGEVLTTIGFRKP
ncbi:MAG: class I SAM-dependent methyltransferase [Chloroflexota bacterium]|nr:MAG: class I SAM-dependent methyltransferase [Chloroflexota bacterium]